MSRLRTLTRVLVAVVLAVPLLGVTTTGAIAAPLLGGGFVDFGCAHARLHCLGKAIKSPDGPGPLLASMPVGYGPAEIQAAYGLAGRHGEGRTVAIVDAMDAPTAESDLATYRAARGLSPCTSQDGCFRKVNQHGDASPLPAPDFGWAEEISLDLDAVSATCPDCRILLVEADSPDTDPLMTAVDTAAATPGVVAISNSYGGAEDPTITAADIHLDHPGIAITASSGDAGYGVSWPASSPHVTAVGGTTLKKSAGTTRGWAETTWSGSGSGCSALEPKPEWQHDTACAKRTVADVAAVADPKTGLGVYDTYNSCGGGALCDALLALGLAQGADGWVQVGGTSLSSPVVASVYALAGNHVTGAAGPYAHPASLFDVTSGSNGKCGGSYLCTAGAGYDGPTGLGTPNGTGAF
ncbi:S53 family peptidase [Amycolatopsis rhabdoformis]|uniref:S53 family peptidase n=1 Tax=Amycolatopsis rhabdoformis TaxID=1448059 RepID=A0ABZ1IFJ5_9PSEU|nr:S53 family peptidase [Amycolatopsis rhabdoformis]WSE33037.1 S53 family peptidase [Amycolatopsis rhabdoformis]